MTVTLVDYFKQATDPLHKGFIADLLRYSDLIGIVPIVDTPGLRVSGTRWQTLPGAAFRQIGAGYTESTGTTEQVQESMAILGGDVKIDAVLTGNSETREDPLVTQMKMKAKAVAFQFNDSFINGDQTVDVDSFEGIKVRNSNMPARMTLDLASAGDSLKVLADSASRQTFLDSLHDASKYVNGATHFLMNENTFLGVGRILRREGLLETITDSYDRKFSAFNGVPYVDVGFKADKSTEIITDTEDPGDGGDDATSIYVVRMDTDEGLHAVQLEGEGMNVYDPLNGGEMESGPQYLRRIDWPIGLFNLSQYTIARIQGFKMAAA